MDRARTRLQLALLGISPGQKRVLYFLDWAELVEQEIPPCDAYRILAKRHNVGLQSIKQSVKSIQRELEKKLTI